jgi:hypothetical protein
MKQLIETHSKSDPARHWKEEFGPMNTNAISTTAYNQTRKKNEKFFLHRPTLSGQINKQNERRIFYY